MMRPIAAGAVLAGLLAFSVAASPTSTAAPETPRSATTAIDRKNRDAVRSAYLRRLKPALAVPVTWNGSTSRCTPGTPSAAAQTATRDAINYYRSMAGVDPVTLDPAVTSRAQRAALIMDAQGDLSHTPPRSWRCWSQVGADAAGRSNLALGATGAAAIALYMDDPGSGNTFVGHRRWVLNPFARTMGSGSTGGANALYVMTPGAEKRSGPGWLPWPTSGYFPTQVEPGGRWSLSTAAAGFDLSRAKVAVTTSSGRKLPVKVAASAPGYGNLATVAWDVTGIVRPKPGKTAIYKVTVTGILKAGRATSYTYRVHIFDAEKR